jgi:hypothetical protein
MRSAAIKCLLIVVFAATSGFSRVCVAQVQLPTVNLGLTNFEDGFAAPGWILQEFPDYFDASTLRDAQGNTVPGSNHLISASTSTHLVYVSEQQLAGGWLAFEVLQPWVHLHVDFANGPSSTVRAVEQATVLTANRLRAADEPPIASLRVAHPESKLSRNTIGQTLRTYSPRPVVTSGCSIWMCESQAAPVSIPKRRL